MLNALKINKKNCTLSTFPSRNLRKFDNIGNVSTISVSEFYQSIAVELYQRTLKATSHLTIFDMLMRPLREDQRHQRLFTPERRLAIPVIVIIPFKFARCTLHRHGNR